MDLQGIRKQLDDFAAGKLTPSEKEDLQQALAALTEEERLELFPVDDYLQQGKFELPEDEVTAAMERVRTATGYSGKRTVLSQWKKISQYAAMFILVSGSLFFLWKNGFIAGNKKNVQVAKRYRTMRVPDGNHGTLLLPDGTRITVNGGSELSFPEEFEGSERIVYLKEGEAYFEIAQDAEHPFIVNTQQLKVQVLGTSFSIRDYNNEKKASVFVNSGRIAVTAGTSLELIAGTGSILDKDKGTIIKEETDISNVAAWIRGECIFQDAGLQEVLQVLQHKYAIQFEVKDPELLKHRFTATFRNNSIQSVMQQLKLMSNISYTITDNHIIIQ